MAEPRVVEPRALTTRHLDALGAGDATALWGRFRRASAAEAGCWAVQIADAVPQRARADLRHGRRLAEAAMALARRARDPIVLARALRADGHRHALHAEYRRAHRRYASAAALFARHGDRLQLAVTFSGALQTQIYLGLYERALADAAVARAIFRGTGDRLRLARLDSNVGNIHFRQDRFERALTCYRRAAAGMRALDQAQDVAVALRNMAVCLTSLNRFDEALATYEEARRHCAAHGLRLLVAEADYNVAYLHFLCGDYDRARQAYAAARAEAAALGDRYHRVLCDLDEAEVCLELNDDQGAHARAAEAAEGFAALGMRYERAKALAFLGTAHARLGNLPAARLSFRRSGALFTADRNRAWAAVVTLARATAHFRAGALPEAARDLARVSARALPPASRVLRDLLGARLALRRARLAPARRAAARAAATLRTVHAPALEWQVHLVTGEVMEAARDEGAAALCYRRARRAIERLRGAVSGDELRIAYLTDKLDVYEHLVHLALGSPAARSAAVPADAGAVLQLVEDAKSRSLAELLAFRAGTLEGDSAAAAPAATVRGLRREMRAFERRLSAETLRPAPDTARVRRMRASAAGRARRLSAALETLHASDPHLGELRADARFSADAIRAALPAGNMLLEYFVARGAVYAFVVTPARVTAVRLGPLEAVERALRLLRFQIAKFQLGPDYVRTFGAVLATATHGHLEELHALLVAPLLPGLTARHVVIVPHGILHYVPFHALFDGRQYLMDRFTVSYAPSAAVYRICQARPPSPHQDSLVLAMSDGHAPHIASEAAEVCRVLPRARLFTGEEARADRLRSAGASARVVHVATHGFFRRDNPMLSSVRLAGGDLTLADLYTLTLDADLVTLSGCGTGLSAVLGGDELVGLMRGLLHAGARSVLLTMWQVDDLSTAEFMGRFYRSLVGGEGPAQAAASAMRALRERFPHPYYWAPFILTGRTSAPYISGPAAVPIDVEGPTASGTETA